MRKSIARMCDRARGIKVVGTAADGAEACELNEKLEPDVVTLDVMMPGMDGIAALERIMDTRPVPVLMVSALTSEGADTTLEALDKGAVDVVEKPAVMPNMNMPLIEGELIEKIRVLAGVDPGLLHRVDDAACEDTEAGADELASQTAEASADLLVIGASTGGPPAIRDILSHLPRSFPVPVVVVQHMPSGFTETMAHRLDGCSPLDVKEASDGDLLMPGRVLVAPSGKQMHFLERRGGHVTVRLDLRPPDTAHIPSVDVTMRSAAEVFGDRGVGVLLTGMGADGAQGLLEMHDAGAYTIAESESSAVVWGMPRAAIEMGAADDVLHCRRIPRAILDRVLVATSNR
jgi:two-component system chemotaxis response regulator CheB